MSEMRANVMGQRVVNGERECHLNMGFSEDGTDHLSVSFHGAISAKISQKKHLCSTTGHLFYVVELSGRDEKGNTINLCLYSESALVDSIETKDYTKRK